MAERRSDSGLRKRDRGKAKVGKPSIENQDLSDDQTTDAFQENQSDDPVMILPFKKRREDDAHAQVGDDEIPQEDTGPPSSTQQESQPKHNKISQENTTAPSNSPYQIQRNAPGPGSRYIPSVDYCLAKILTSFEVIPESPMLHLDPIEASILADDSEVDEYSPGSFTKNILVFDSQDRRYHMLLSNYLSGGRVKYALAGDWKRFVRTHILKAGDEVTFYQILDTRISDDCYYVIKYFRKPADRKGYAPPGKNRKKPSDDGQRDSKGSYKLESRRNETGGLVIKVGRR